ncbi:MAG: pectate lyase, partial [Paludibacteraceae bacterium]|nr:pectate lyase [Paludibacteraceae bacterium]
LDGRIDGLAKEQSAEEAYETVLAKAGCSLVRDLVDTRIVNDVKNGTGKLINTQAEVGGWPELLSATKPVDTDYDGIPDEWESQFGLNPNDPLDARNITLVTGFTNLEVYMRYLVRNLYD